MAKDARLYAKFTLDFPDSHKILPLSDAAFRALVEMTIYSRRMLTDGFVAKPLALARWGLEVCQELLANDAANPSLTEVENGYQLHDFAKHQSTKAEIEALTAKRKAAGQKGGRSKALASAKQNASKTPSKTYPERETEREIKEEANASSSLPRASAATAGGKGSRLSPGWMPDPKVIEQMRAECSSLDLKAEHAVFTDYWIAQPGARGRKSDWNATWRNWMRRAAERVPGPAPGLPRLRAVGSTTDERVAQTLALAARYEAEERTTS